MYTLFEDYLKCDLKTNVKSSSWTFRSLFLIYVNVHGMYTGNQGKYLVVLQFQKVKFADM